MSTVPGNLDYLLALCDETRRTRTSSFNRSCVGADLVDGDFSRVRAGKLGGLGLVKAVVKRLCFW
jgi:hypothetical protein